jgi:8-oxo-dGTP pyrophosphatase MutT (NUDIX family)
MKAKHVTLLFLIKDGQILLAMKKRGFGAGRFNGIGGKIEPNETIEQAMIRECQEEIEVTPTNYWKVAEHDFLVEGGNAWRMYAHVYFCDEWQGEPNETEEMAPQWFNRSDIPYDKMWQDDAHWLPQVLEGQKVFGDFTFDSEDNMLTSNVTAMETLPHET